MMLHALRHLCYVNDILMGISDSFNYITKVCSIHLWFTEDKLRSFREDITRLNKMTDQNLGQEGNQLLPSRGRMRGLLAVWVKTRMRRGKIWISASTTSGCSMVATLAFLSKMVAQNATKVPGTKTSPPNGEEFS